jgi:hypothetical protein
MTEPMSTEYRVLLEEGQSLSRVADGPRISVVVRDGVVLVGEGVVVLESVDLDFVGEVIEGVTFDPKVEVSDSVDFDSESKLSEAEVTAGEAVGDDAALSPLCDNAKEDDELSALVASLPFFAARLPPTPPATAPTTTIVIITVRNIQKVRGARPQMMRSGGGGGDGAFFSR